MIASGRKHPRPVSTDHQGFAASRAVPCRPAVAAIVGVTRGCDPISPSLPAFLRLRGMPALWVLQLLREAGHEMWVLQFLQEAGHARDVWAGACLQRKGWILPSPCVLRYVVQCCFLPPPAHCPPPPLCSGQHAPPFPTCNLAPSCSDQHGAGGGQSGRRTRRRALAPFHLPIRPLEAGPLLRVWRERVHRFQQLPTAARPSRGYGGRESGTPAAGTNHTMGAATPRPTLAAYTERRECRARAAFVFRQAGGAVAGVPGVSGPDGCRWHRSSESRGRGP